MVVVNPTETSFSPSQLAEQLRYLGDIQRKHQEYIKAKYKLNGLEMEIIQLVALDGPRKMKEIGAYFHVKLSTLTSIIDKIETQKLVKRVPSKDDRRVVLLEPTRKGKKLYQDYSQYLQMMISRMPEALSEDRLTAVIAGLNLLTTEIDNNING